MQGSNSHRRVGKQFIILTALFYLFFAAVALVWGCFSDHVSPLALNLPRPRLAVELLIIVVTLGMNILFDIYGHRLLPSTTKLFESLGSAIGKIGPMEALFLAAASAVGEELFFRGALQPSIGFPAATLLFALSHFPLRRELIAWPFYAFLIGLVLGALKLVGGDVWSAVLLHFSINLFGLMYISRRYL